jgi:flagellin FlaB
VGVINMTVSKAPGANDIDLETLTLQYVSDEEIVDLVHNDSEVVDGANRTNVFNTTTIQDDDDSIANSTVMNDPADRAKIVINVSGGTDSIGFVGGASGDATDIGPINRSASATIQLTTQAGGETTVTITVPDSLTGKDAVEL